MSTEKQQRRVAAQRTAKQAKEAEIDMHDILHSVFWSMPNREEMMKISIHLHKVLLTRKVNMMELEIRELLEEQ